MGKGQQTRDRILEIAQAAILQKGFGATSIDELISEAEITKSGFFYHFKDKNELARALLERYIAQDEIILDDLFARAQELADDPLQSFLVGLKLFSEMLEDLPAGHPGCVVATYCYQERLFDKSIHDINREAVLRWRRRFRQVLDDIAKLYPPNEPVDLDELADMVSTVAEGGIVMSKALKQPHTLPKQILLFRTFIKLLFTPARQH
jgi:AcrR family transcriptional regulator